MATPDKTKEPTERTETAARVEPLVTPRPRRTIASYPTYPEAERAVDWLSDHGFPVEHTAIVGTGLRSVEQVTGRMTPGRAALMGAGGGALLGALFALLFGLFFTGPAFAGLLLYSVVVGALFGAFLAALAQAGQRDFESITGIEADRYNVQADEDNAAEAKRVLDAMPMPVRS